MNVVAKFIAYNPVVKPLSVQSGGGFKLSMDISEDQWEKIKELNNPALKNVSFLVSLVKEG